MGSIFSLALKHFFSHYQCAEVAIKPLLDSVGMFLGVGLIILVVGVVAEYL